MEPTWLDDRGVLLSPRCPLPLDRPFLAAEARALGVPRRDLERLARSGMVRRPLREVYIATQAPDTIDTRAAAISLVLPETAVVADRTAAWLHGVDLLPRTALTTPPDLTVVHVDDTRVRRTTVDGRRRGLLPSDLTTVHGVRATTALRTSLDLGRLLWRFDALAAIDAFLRVGVPHELMSAEAARFRGHRGVRQLRCLVPLGDPRAESPGESALRLHWYDAGLPRPELQLWVYDANGVGRYRLDIADEVVPYAAEYDGEEFHTEEDAPHDTGRREWIGRRTNRDVDAFTKHHVYGPRAEAPQLLRRGYDDARRGLRRWSGQRRR